jgi:hypothetical protein
MTLWLLAVALATTPPPGVSEPPPPMPEPAVEPQPQRHRSQGQRLLPPPAAPARELRALPSMTPEEPARVGITFTPLSFFSLSLFAEVDVALVGGLDVFASVGGGLFGQFGFEGGLRFYAEGRPMEGFFIEARACGFLLPASDLFLMAPGMQLGHAWRLRAFAISLGAGFNTWYTLSAGNLSGIVPFGRPAPADVIIFPGVQVPVGLGPAVQPTLRVAIGFTL